MGHLKTIQITFGMKNLKLNKIYEKIINIIKRFFTKRCCR